MSHPVSGVAAWAPNLLPPWIVLSLRCLRSLERAAAKRQREEHRNRWKWLNRKALEVALPAMGV